MRIKNKMNYWWVWSPDGPRASGVFHGRHFVNGMLPFPVPGDLAAELEYQGFVLKEYEPGDVFSHWEGDNGKFVAVFSQPPEEVPSGMLPDLSLSDLPDQLPDSYIALIERYTAKGRLKRAYRGR